MPTKKKTTKKKVTKKTTTRRKMNMAEQLQRAHAQLLDVVERFNDRLTEDHDEFPQELLSAALTSRRLAQVLSTADKNFVAAVLRHNEAGASMQAPLMEGAPSVLVTLKETTRRTPAWKKEALAFAQELAEERGESFDVKSAEAEVLDRTEPKTSTSVKLEEVL